ncbi:hypothetical protein ARALYDRAFT_890908 [Arabidopsis lyrata subsp. lyrata]|uniref:RNase H type-1 domain-containing protein n=1 Tax=Arabidopsis lyrata subsp. lyrata TaxID=81972 RepID=D7KIH1_ARALL|nr:hypothetical protein ARALYDRAFT_890908 [Arabidopsis lyrata subsp. lyrata]
MQCCWSKGFKRMYFEGDNKEVADILNGKKANFAAFNYIREIRAWKNRFEVCCFVWTNRECNKAADTLAKERVPLDSYYHFYSFVPFVIATLLQNDSVHLI